MIEILTHSIRQRSGPKTQASSQGLEQKRLDQKNGQVPTLRFSFSICFLSVNLILDS
jgi:hypothetical protein